MANIQEQRREVFKEVYGVSIFSDVLDLFEGDYNRYKNKGYTKIQELYKHYSYAIFFMYSPSSIRNNLVKFKNVIKENGGKYQANALEVFTVDAIYAPIKSKDEDTKRDLKEKVRSGKNTKIDPSTVVSQIQALKTELDTKSYSISSNQKEPNVRAYRIVAMLGLATGRRFTELLKTLEIKKRGTKLTFDGLLKGNSEAIEGHIISLSYSEVKKYLKELREFAQTEDMTESEVNSKYAKVFNNAMKRIGVTNVKSTRHNYSVAGSQLFKKDGESLEDTITRILGHKEIFTSALNYT
jgi:hypothetical protein